MQPSNSLTEKTKMETKLMTTVRKTNLKMMKMKKTMMKMKKISVKKRKNSMRKNLRINLRKERRKNDSFHSKNFVKITC